MSQNINEKLLQELHKATGMEADFLLICKTCCFDFLRLVTTLAKRCICLVQKIRYFPKKQHRVPFANSFLSFPPPGAVPV